MTEELSSSEIREKVKIKYGKLYDLVEQVLFLADINDLNTVQNDFYHEYEPEVDRILPLLESANSVDDVLNIILNVFAEMFHRVNIMTTKSYASVQEEYEDSPQELVYKYDSAAKLIWGLSQKFPLDEKCIRLS